MPPSPTAQHPDLTHLCCSRCGMPVERKDRMPAYYEYVTAPGKRRARLVVTRRDGWFVLCHVTGETFARLDGTVKVAAYRTLRSWLKAVGIETQRGPTGKTHFSAIGSPAGKPYAASPTHPHGSARTLSYGPAVRWYGRGEAVAQHAALVAARLIIQVPDRKLARRLFLGWAQGHQPLPTEAAEPMRDTNAIQTIVPGG